MHAANGEKFRALCGQYQGFQGRIHAVEARKNFQAIQFWDADIENNQIRHAFANHLHGIDAVIRFPDDFVTFMFQQHTNGETNDGVIVDNKNGVHNQVPYVRK
ncbi:hypothetical protein D3C81_1746240 [compost metagenome]